MDSWSVFMRHVAYKLLVSKHKTRTDFTFWHVNGGKYKSTYSIRWVLCLWAAYNPICNMTVLLFTVSVSAQRWAKSSKWCHALLIASLQTIAEVDLDLVRPEFQTPRESSRKKKKTQHTNVLFNKFVQNIWRCEHIGRALGNRAFVF